MQQAQQSATGVVKQRVAGTVAAAQQKAAAAGLMVSLVAKYGFQEVQRRLEVAASFSGNGRRPPPGLVLGTDWGVYDDGEGHRIATVKPSKESGVRGPTQVVVPYFFPMDFLALLLGTRDGKRAVELAARAAEATQHQNPGVLDTLAAAYAATGRYADAVKYQQQAIALAPEQAQSEFGQRLQRYQEKTPYVLPDKEEAVSP